MFRWIGRSPLALVVMLYAALYAQEAGTVSRKELLEHLLTRNAPTYPPLARQARIIGSVELVVSVDESGDVADVRLVKGHPMLAPAAIDAVKKWKFRPFEEDGAAVAVTSPLEINFNLEVSPEEHTRQFQSDFAIRMDRANKQLSEGSKAGAEGDANEAIKLAHAADFPESEGKAKLLLARIHDADQRDAEADFKNAVELFRQAELQGRIESNDINFCEALFYSGVYHIKRGHFGQADDQLERALKGYSASTNRGTLEVPARIARISSMLAATNLRLNRPKAAAAACRIFNNYKRNLHGLELDEAAQSCDAIH